MVWRKLYFHVLNFWSWVNVQRSGENILFECSSRIPLITLQSARLNWVRLPSFCQVGHMSVACFPCHSLMINMHNLRLLSSSTAWFAAPGVKHCSFSVRVENSKFALSMYKQRLRRAQWHHQSYKFYLCCFSIPLLGFPCPHCLVRDHCNPGF